MKNKKKIEKIEIEKRDDIRFASARRIRKDLQNNIISIDLYSPIEVLAIKINEIIDRINENEKENNSYS